MNFRCLALVAIGACASPSPTPRAAPLEVPVIVSAAPVASIDAAAPSTLTSRKLRLVQREDSFSGYQCSVIDDATGKVVGHATSQNTAAGGSMVECHDFLADGKIIRFINSRGIYAKDARPGADDTQVLSCGDGVFATDVTSCVTLDTASQVFEVADASTPAAAFDIELCSATKFDCTLLVSIPRGRNRFAGSTTLPRWWDATYCSNTRVVVVAEGVLRLFDARSRKLLAKTSAPGAVSIERCEGGVAETRNGKNIARYFDVSADTLTPLAR